VCRLFHINMKAHTQPTRHLVFSLIDTLLAQHRPGMVMFRHDVRSLTSSLALQALGEDFVKGYIKIAEGEKDPRNLLLAFAIDKVLLLEFDVSKHIEVSTYLSAFNYMH
jgi:DNA repair/transcription protein MET18/MMS19